MSDTIRPVSEQRKTDSVQTIDRVRKPVPTMPLILDRMAYKFQRGVLITSLAREFECPPSFIEAVIRRELQRSRERIAMLERRAA